MTGKSENAASGSWRVRLLIACIALLLAVDVCVGTGLIPGWGRWYSRSIPYRLQTEALLAGRVALSHDPTDLRFDMAWAEGGVEQVWGLGVPFWRLPFELAARLVGQPAFPDRIALALAIAAAGCVVIGALLPPPAPEQTAWQWLDAAISRPERLAAILVLMLFPPILTLASGPFNVYEEPVVYGYYYSIGLFAATVAFVRWPTPGRYSAISLMAGLIGFVRPTLMAYGFSTALLCAVAARRAGWRWKASSAGPALFALGGLLLYWSNVQRFGAGLEFGHNLNATGKDIMYASRFGSPFDDELVFAKARELVGALFFVNELNGLETFHEGVVRWQVPSSRWRHFYATTFDASYLLAVLGCWAWAAWGLTSGWRKRDIHAASELSISATWSLASVVPLVGFYVHYYSISSRYMLDFAPAIAAALTGVLLHACRNARWMAETWIARGALLFGVMAWWTRDLVLAESFFSPKPAYTQAQAVDLLRPRDKIFAPLPMHYEASAETRPAATGIIYNGFGWESKVGRTGVIVVFFIEDTDRLRLDVEPAEGEKPTDEEYAQVRAKVGLEMLEIESIEATERGRRLTFAPPKRAAYRQGVQVVFLAFVPPDDFRMEHSPFRLLRVDWREEADAGGDPSA